MVFGGGLDGDENRGLVGIWGGAVTGHTGQTGLPDAAGMKGDGREHRSDGGGVQFRLKKTRVGQGQVHPAVTRHFVPFGPDLLKLVDEDVEETALTTIERG